MLSPQKVFKFGPSAPKGCRGLRSEGLKNGIEISLVSGNVTSISVLYYNLHSIGSCFHGLGQRCSLGRSEQDWFGNRN